MVVLIRFISRWEQFLGRIACLNLSSQIKQKMNNLYPLTVGSRCSVTQLQVAENLNQITEKNEKWIASLVD